MMNIILKNLFMVLSCSTALFLTACDHSNTADNHSGDNGGGDNGGDNGEEKPIIDERDYISEEPYRIDTLKEAKSINIMKYNMKNVLDKTAEATALVIFPKTPQPTDGWRIVVWQHGSVGVANHCAPSMNLFNQNFRTLADELLAAGYVIVAPDYEGLGSPGIHPYLHLASEAKSARAAIKAIKHQYAQQLNGAWVAIGQSQGGHASLATAEYANSDPMYKGTIAIGPTLSLDQVILDLAPTALRELEKQEMNDQVALGERRSISAYAALLANTALIGAGIKAYAPQFGYQDIFQPRARALAERAEGINGLCLQDDDPKRSLVRNFQQDIIKFMQENTKQSVMDYPGLDREAFKTSAIVTQFLADNEPATKRLDKPVVVIQWVGELENPVTVTAQMVERLITDLKSPDVNFIIIDKLGQQQELAILRSGIKDFLTRVMPAKR